MNVNILKSTGEQSGEVTLDDSIFAAKVSVPLMHQVVVGQLAAARAGTHKTKTRGEVRGGGVKPWRQKGTGRARHGSSREPQWKGGGTVFGPVPRDHSLATPKKMKAAALRSALSQRVKEGKLLVVEPPVADKPRTRDAIAALGAWKVEDKVLLVLTTDEQLVAFSFRNLPEVHILDEQQLNVYDVMNADTLLISKSAIDALQARLSKTKTEPAPAAAPSEPTPAPAPEPAPAAPPAETEAEGDA